MNGPIYNPYAPLRADLTPRDDDDHREAVWEPASFAERFIGASIDLVCDVAAIGAMYFGAGLFGDGFGGAAGVAAVLSHTAINAYFVHRSGQTIGKKFARTWMVLENGRKAPLWRVALLRWLVPGLLGAFVPIFALVNIAFIFLGSERRCLHDRIAGTLVVSARKRVE